VGGLLDATTDILYMLMEVFHEPILVQAAVAIVLLPLVMVALAFWPLMVIEYKTQAWRYLFLPLEGAVLLVVLPFTATAYLVPLLAKRVASASFNAVETVAAVGGNAVTAIYKKMYTEVTEKEVEKRVDGNQRRV
jgi:hypothetical protein